MKTTKEFISPESAKEILRNNKNNRIISVETVNRYARDMRSGAWKLTHQGILLGHGGCLIDGQHRLLGIVKSGVGQWMLVTRDESLQSAIDVPVDVGNKRKASFVLGVSTSLAALAAYALKVGKGINAPSAADLKPYINMFAEPLDQLQNGSKTGKRVITTAPVLLAGVTRIMRCEDVDYIAKTFQAMVNDRFAELSPMAASFYKQVVVDRVGMDQRQIFSRAMRVFDASRKEKSKLQIKDEALAYEEARQMVIDVLEEREAA